MRGRDEDWPKNIAIVIGGLLLISFLIGKTDWKDVASSLATLIAAYAGARSAFQFQARQKAADERDTNVAAGNRALTAILYRFNTLENVYRDSMAEFASSPARHFQVLPTLPVLPVDPIDLNSLGFLIPHGASQALADLFLEEQRYQEAVQALNARSEFVRLSVQPKVSARVGHGSSAVLGELEATLDEHEAVNLLALTDIAFFQVESTLSSLLEVKVRLLAALKKYAPDAKFFDFEAAKPLPPKPERPAAPRAPLRRSAWFGSEPWPVASTTFRMPIWSSAARSVGRQPEEP